MADANDRLTEVLHGIEESSLDLGERDGDARNMRSRISASSCSPWRLSTIHRVILRGCSKLNMTGMTGTVMSLVAAL